MHYLFDQFVTVQRLVYRAQGNQFVQGQSEAINVGPNIALALKAFRGHVAERAHNVAGIRQIVGPRHLG